MCELCDFFQKKKKDEQRNMTSVSSPPSSVTVLPPPFSTMTLHDGDQKECHKNQGKANGSYQAVKLVVIDGRTDVDPKLNLRVTDVDARNLHNESAAHGVQ